MKKRKMTKPILIMTLIIIISSLIGCYLVIPPCIGSSVHDVHLEIKSDSTTIQNGSREFVVKFILHNTCQWPVCVEGGFSVGDNIYLEMMGPEGEIRLRYPVTDKIASKTWLITTRVYEKNIAIYDGKTGSTTFRWDIPGNYSLTAYYEHPYDGYARTESNTIEFKIVE